LAKRCELFTALQQPEAVRHSGLSWGRPRVRFHRGHHRFSLSRPRQRAPNARSPQDESGSGLTCTAHLKAPAPLRLHAALTSSR
jgi:hypothetical protein